MMMMIVCLCIQQLHTDVLTVNLFSCDGQPIIVSNLTSEHVELSIPHNVHLVSLSLSLFHSSSLSLLTFCSVLVKFCLIIVSL